MHKENPELLALIPVFQERIWGGRRLKADFGYELPEGPIGECWAISAHPHGCCHVADGPLAGAALSELWENRRDLFGDAPGKAFPLLVKILDANDELSVQVHPDDAYAAKHEGGSLGKRECWYVLDAQPGAKIIVGQRASGREEFASLAEQGRWDELLNTVPVNTGDFFAIEPGTVHALCKGALILETQQSSDLTYRIYDYDRLGADGHPRELHLEKALDVIDYTAPTPAPGTGSISKKDGVTHLLHNESFDVLRICAHQDAPAAIEHNWDYLCMSVVSGKGSIHTESGAQTVSKGDHFIATAYCSRLVFRGELELICSFVAR